MAEEKSQEETPKKGGGLIGRLLIAVFMALVIGSECLLAYFWLPSADQVAAKVQQMAQQAEKESGGKEDKQADAEVSEVEVDLGKFTVTNHHLLNEATFRVDFHLYGTVADEDQAEFDELFKRNEHRFRDSVIIAIRDSKVDDLTAPELGLIKRRILAKSNTVLGKALLRSIIFADYSFVEL